MRFFCTYFDSNYLPRGLALYRSLQMHCPDFRLLVLCMDDSSRDVIDRLNLPGVHTISMGEFERNDEPLQRARDDRSRIEYYFTCTPSLPLYVFRNWSEVALLTYLDADLFFFGNPEPLFDELGQGSIGMTAHRFTDSLKDRERYGIYNVGWLTFRNDEHGIACLTWWRERCLEWCFDREEDGRFADQKYLDDWPVRFGNVVVLQHKGANLAPWNLNNYHVRYSRSDGVAVDGQPLIFFHFHGLRQANRWVFDPGWKEYGVNESKSIRAGIYVPYLRTLFATSRKLLGSTRPNPFATSSRIWNPEPSGPISPLRRLARALRARWSNIREIAEGRVIFLPGP